MWEAVNTTTSIVGRVTQRQLLSAFSQWTVDPMVVGTFLLVYMQVFHFRAFMPPIAIIFGVPALIFASVSIAIRRPRAPMLGAL